MPNAWDRPGTGSPFRMGHATADPLHLAVGQALSKWERLEGEMAHLYSQFLSRGEAPYFNIPAVRAFGTLNSPAAKADMITAAAEAYFHWLAWDVRINVSATVMQELEVVEAELRSILKSYRGWMSRRNDIAHGYVAHTGPWDDNTVTHLLYPSECSTNKWCVVVGEPAYAYEAKHIDVFGTAFEALEAAVRKLCDGLTEFDKKVRALLPQRKKSTMRPVSNDAVSLDGAPPAHETREH